MDPQNSSYVIDNLNETKQKELYSKSPSRQSFAYVSYLIEQEETYSEEVKSGEDNKSEMFDKSFNSHEIYTETEDNEDQQYYYPKIIDVNRNNLVLNRSLSKIDFKSSSTEFQSFLLLAKYFFSVGILALPYVYNLTGYVLGSVLIILTAAMTIYSVHLVIDVHSDMLEKNQSQHLHQKLNASITDVAFRVFGTPGQLICRFFSLINNLGGCISYVVFFEIYIAQIIQTYWIKNISNEQAHLVGALVAFAVLLPFSTVNHLSLFWQTNLIGFFFGLTAIICMFYTDISFINEVGGLSRNHNDMWRTDHVFLALGIVIYSLQIIPVALNVRDCMERPQNFIPVFQISTTFTCIVYLCFGVVSHMAIGEYVDDIVLLNFAPQTVMGFFVRFFYTISVLLSYPLKFYVVISIYENLKCYKEKIFCQDKYEKHDYHCTYTAQMALAKRYIVRFGLILFIFILSLFTIKIAKLLALLGSLATLVLQFIIPQLIYMKYYQVSLPRVIYGLIICIFFLIAACFGVYRSIESLFT